MGFSFDDVDRFKAHFQTTTDVHIATQLILAKLDDMEAQMGTLAEGLTTLSDALTGLETDVQRVLAALGSPGVTLNAEAQSAVDALAARMGTLDTNMDAAVPEAPPVP